MYPDCKTTHKQNGYLENLLVFQNSLCPEYHVHIHEQSDLDYVSFGKPIGFQGNHFVCEGEAGKLVVGMCVSMWVC